MIDDLLDVSRLNAGRLTLETEDVDLTALCREVVERFSEELEKSRSQLDLQLEPLVVGRWDRRRLDQVIVNLVSNAIKYGGGQPITVTLKSEGGDAVLEVRDRGIGISPEDQARVFRRFERAVSARHFGGLGLGLWIVSEIVRCSGGTISLESVVDRGSRFEVRLPLAGPPPGAPEPPASDSG